MNALSAYHQACLGKFDQVPILRSIPLIKGNAHPIHPISVHYPITFLLASYSLDIFTHLRSSLPSLPSRLSSFTPPASPILSQISYYSNVAGLLTLAPALITGFHEIYEIYKNKGGVKKEPLTDKEELSDEQRAVNGLGRSITTQSYPDRVFRIAAFHGIMNVFISGTSLYSYFLRSSPSSLYSKSASFLSSSSPSNTPLSLASSTDSKIFYLSAFSLITLIVSAALGGQLVYGHGIGVMRNGEGVEERRVWGKDVQDRETERDGLLAPRKKMD